LPKRRTQEACWGMGHGPPTVALVWCTLPSGVTEGNLRARLCLSVCLSVCL
jgi:hypothetical protein